jgi:hypothetical protein
MRAATYKIPPASGDQEGAECAVYFFGAGQGGSVHANIERWNGQVTGSDGKPATAHIQKRTVHGLPVKAIDVAGQYSVMGGPMATAKTSKLGYRLLGAVIERKRVYRPRKDHRGERAELRAIGRFVSERIAVRRRADLGKREPVALELGDAAWGRLVEPIRP